MTAFRIRPQAHSGPQSKAGLYFAWCDTNLVLRREIIEPILIDYAVVISGAIEMELDDGVVVKLKAGDVLVQRGTIHNWVNRGTEDCIIAFVLISARPVKAGTSSLEAVG